MIPAPAAAAKNLKNVMESRSERLDLCVGPRTERASECILDFMVKSYVENGRNNKNTSRRLHENHGYFGPRGRDITGWL